MLVFAILAPHSARIRLSLSPAFTLNKAMDWSYAQCKFGSRIASLSANVNRYEYLLRELTSGWCGWARRLQRDGDNYINLLMIAHGEDVYTC